MNISWKFAVADSTWWGGFLEILVQSVKRSLRKILFRSTKNYEETVTEIEGIINCSSLTYLYNDNAVEVVTPSDLTYGRRLLAKPVNDKPNNFNLENLTRTYFNLTLLEPLKIEYSKELREYHRCRKEVDTRINAGDIALVEYPVFKRNYWKLGKLPDLSRDTMRELEPQQ